MVSGRPILCRLGRHRWGYFGAGVVGLINARRCSRCGAEQFTTRGEFPKEPRG